MTDPNLYIIIPVYFYVKDVTNILHKTLLYHHNMLVYYVTNTYVIIKIIVIVMNNLENCTNMLAQAFCI